MKNTSSQMLERYILAQYSLIAIVSHEESRVMEAIKKVASNLKLTSGKKVPRIVVEWSLTEGFVVLTKNSEVRGLLNKDASTSPNPALEFIANFDKNSEEEHSPVLFVVKDLHRILNQDVQVLRYLRDIAFHLESTKHAVILLSPELNLPSDIEKQIAVLDWALPDYSELETVLSNARENLDESKVAKDLNAEQIIQAMQGLTLVEATNALLSGIVACAKLSNDVLPYIIQEKKQIIRKSGILEYFEASVTMSDVGGLENLKEYALMKRNAMTAEARKAGVDTPKGVLLVGVPGTGKSLSAKAIAGGQFPLLRMDMGKLLGGGIVGQAENNITSALKVAEAIAPCVLWIDEIEKALANNGGASDGGVIMRVIGSFLTWMQETTSPVYTVATCNSVSILRPELLERFDNVMFVDVPDKSAREEILQVHLNKRGVKNIKDLKEVVLATKGFSGREIEKVVKFAIEKAFFEEKVVTVKHLIDSANKIVPTGITKADEIKALREWAKDKAIPAGNPLEADEFIIPTKQKIEI